MKPTATAVSAALAAAVLLAAGCSPSARDDATPPATAPSGDGGGPRAASTQVAPATPIPSGAPRLQMEVVAKHPFDAGAFTQGLEIDDDGSLLVGTGQYGESAIWRVRDWAAGSPAEDRRDLDPRFFGEGITRAGDTVWQLTWRAGVAVRRDAGTLAETGRESYDGEGWGLCALDDRLVMSDGSDELTFRDPVTFAETGRVGVRVGDAPVDNINELDCVDGPEGPEVWANRWLTGDILRIDPATGGVTGVADASPLRASLPPEALARADVLNGIAHLPGTDRFLVTGKYWPTLFEVRFTGPGGAELD